MQPRTPPENVELGEREVNTHDSTEASRVTIQVPIHPNGRFSLSIHFEPTLRPELASVWTPQVLVPVTKRKYESTVYSGKVQ